MTISDMYHGHTTALERESVRERQWRDKERDGADADQENQITNQNNEHAQICTCVLFFSTSHNLNTYSDCGSGFGSGYIRTKSQQMICIVLHEPKTIFYFIAFAFQVSLTVFFRFKFVRRLKEMEKK